MRRQFHPILLKYMREDKRIHVVTGDLGYKMFDAIQEEFPDRFHNVGAREQLAAGVCVGLAMSHKIPVFYSITPFALWRPAEWLRNYLNHEKWPVKICGGGRGQDYIHDQFTHFCGDDKDILAALPNIRGFWPESIDDLSWATEEWLYHNEPAYLNLKR